LSLLQAQQKNLQACYWLPRDFNHLRLEQYLPYFWARGDAKSSVGETELHENNLNRNHKVSSGDMAPVSGLYRTDHSQCAEKELWVSAGERLPLCSRCGKQARFSLQQEVDHISKDVDFR
jgi:hypothetical protein